jgi:hypothetical protein
MHGERRASDEVDAWNACECCKENKEKQKRNMPPYLNDCHCMHGDQGEPDKEDVVLIECQCLHGDKKDQGRECTKEGKP